MVSLLFTQHSIGIVMATDLGWCSALFALPELPNVHTQTAFACRIEPHYVCLGSS